MALSKKVKAEKAAPKKEALMHTCAPRSNKSLCKACVAEMK